MMAAVEPAQAPPMTSLLFNPNTFDPTDLDDESRRILRATIDFFEERGKAELKRADHEREWYADFLDFVKRERVFATLLTPAADADGDAEKRWDTTRICHFNEITGFYGLAYWYTWQVSILGLGPIWQSENAAARRARREAARRRRDLRLRPLRARARRRHLLDRHAPDAGRRRRLHRERRQVLHRQRQRGRDGLGVRPPHGRRGPRRLRLLRRRLASTRTTSWSRTSSTPRCTSASSG